MSKYRILIDYGTEGMNFWDDTEYEDLTEAVKEAIANSYGSSFLIVQVVDWKALEALSNHQGVEGDKEPMPD